MCWFPGSSLPVHTDNCKDYLSQRHISVVIWLSSQGEDFEGGDFFFQGAGGSGEVVQPRAGCAALFKAEEPHGLREVVRGSRLALNIWFTRDPNAAEDVRLLGCQPSLHHAERLFGAGPQAFWPKDAAAARLAKRTLAQAGLPSRGGPLRPRRKARAQSSVDPPVLPTATRAKMAVAGFRVCTRSSCTGPCFFNFMRRRERRVRGLLPRWHTHGLLSLPHLRGPPCCRCRLLRGSVEHVAGVPGLVIARGALTARLQRSLRKLADGLMTSDGKLTLRLFWEVLIQVSITKTTRPHSLQLLVEACFDNL